MKLFNIQHLLLLIGCFIFFTCTNDDRIEEDDKLIDKYLWVTDEYGETEYAVSFINEVNEYVAFFKENEEGVVKSIDYLYNGGESLVTVSFNEDGLVESIGGDSLTVVFSNYVGNKVDIAFVYKDEVAVINDHETEFVWDDLASTSTLVSRAWYDVVEKYSRFLYSATEQFGIVLSSAANIGKITHAGISGLAELKIKNIAFGWLKDLRDEALKTYIEGKFKYEIAQIDMIKLGFSVYAITASFGNPSSMILNYSSYEDFFYAITWWSAQVYDELSKELASGALLRIAINSYEQTRPATHNRGNVTFKLSANVTYTQMGTDVKEWGIALFKGNELINRYPVANISEKTQVIDFSFDITKEQFDLDYDDYIATPKDEWYLKAYEINNQNPNIPIFGRSETVLNLVYDQKPSITIVDLEVGETVDIDEDGWDRKCFYTFKIITTGSLFMEECYTYWEGYWTHEGKGESWLLADGKWWSPGSSFVKYSSKAKKHTDYRYYIATVDGEKMKSTNYLQYEIEGINCRISLINGVVDSKSRSIVDVDAIEGACVSISPIQIE